jgi:hypothetical protein
VDAVEGTGEDLRHRRLPRPPGADEQIGVMDAVLLHGIGEGSHDVLLTDHLSEALRAVAAVKRS